MAGSASFDRVVDVFTELGWAEAAVDDVPTLPLGTAAQRTQVQADLRKMSRLGEWWEQVKSGGPAGVDPLMVWFFAVRAGVDAGRATWMLDEIPGTRLRRPGKKHWHWRDDLGDVNDVMVAVVAERGSSFAQTFVARFDARDPWHTWREPGPFSGAVVRLTAQLRLPVSTHLGYLEPWLVHALGVLTDDCSPVLGHPGEPRAPYASMQVQVPADMVRDRFAEHVLAGAVNPQTSPMFAQRIRADERCPPEHNRLLVAAVAAGWLDRDAATDLVLAILDTAGRPVDRKNWLDVWLTGLGASDEQVVAHVDALVPVLAKGDAAVIERLAPTLVAGIDDRALADVALAALTAPTKKARKTVLDALAARPCPSAETREIIGPQVTGLDVGRDRSLARAVQAVIDAWGLLPDVPVEPVVEGLWRPVPPLWTQLRFDHGPETPEALTQAAAELSSRRDSSVVDIAVERFLALANAVARRDPGMARTALAGVRKTWDAGLAPVASWVEGHVDGDGAGDRSAGLDDRCAPLRARELSVFRWLGQVPCLLSEPSTVDLRIAPADVLSRLRAYQDAGASASEADLLVALTRLDVSAADDRLRAELEQFSVPVVLWSGETMPTTAGPAVSRYLADPAVEPEPVEGEARRGLESVPESLRSFPARLDRDETDFAVFPTWGDTVLRVDAYQFNRDLGLQMRRLALHAAPLPPSVVLNFLSARRAPHPAAVDDTARAVTEAWERGLLRPGTPGTRYVDLAEAPNGLAADVRSLAEAAREGLLAVVWQILDDLAGASSSGQRLATGAAEVVEAVATFLPEVLHAVAEGVADPAVLNLPGVRAVAERTGTSKAVTTAREIVAGIPALTMPATAAPTPTGPAFEEIWPDGAGTLPAVVDDATVTAAWVDPDLPTRMLRFDLTLPDHVGVRFEVIKGSTHDMEAEGQCLAQMRSADAVPEKPAGSGYSQSLRGGDDVYLSWDSTAERLRVDERRDWGRTPAPLSTSLVAVSVGLVAQDGDYGSTGEDLVTYLVEKGRIGWAGVQVAVRTLLSSPDVSPARLVRVLEKNPTTLPVLWPLLTEPIRVAGASEGSPPRWLNRVLDVALLYADYLREAGRRGWLPADVSGWSGLDELVSRPGKTAALTKARSLRAVLRGD